jgi:nucleotide-binding universal stress UspA family protein
MARLRANLDDVASHITREDIAVNTLVRTGSVVDTISEVARDGFDLIVMATHGRTGLGKVILGSVAADLLPVAPCPVLVIPPGCSAKALRSSHQPGLASVHV